MPARMEPMDPATLTRLATPSLTILLVLTFLSVIAALSFGALLVSRKALSPALTGLSTGGLGLALLGLTLWAASSADPSSLEGSQAAVAAGTGVLLVVPFFGLASAFLHGVLCLGGALRDGPRRWAWVATGVLPGLALVGAPALGGWLVGNGFFELSLLRVVPYGLLVLLTLPALAAGGEEVGGAAGAASSASASVSLLAYVALGEASLRGVFAFLMQGRFAGLPDAASREAFVVNARADLLDPILPWSWVAFGAAAVLVLLAHIPLLRRQGPVAAAGLVWVPLMALPMLLADVPVSSWAALAAAMP